MDITFFPLLSFPSLIFEPLFLFHFQYYRAGPWAGEPKKNHDNKHGQQARIDTPFQKGRVIMHYNSYEKSNFYSFYSHPCVLHEYLRSRLLCRIEARKIE